MTNWTTLLSRIRPYSFSALCVAVGALAVATILRFAVAWPFVNATFIPFFPAVLLVTLVAGAPAGAIVTIGGALIGSFAFTPSADTQPGEDTFSSGIAFVIAAACMVVVCDWCRNLIRRLQARDEERDLLMKELEHRGRNTYSVVESIVRNTLLDDPKSAHVIAGRVRAVSSSNDLVNWSTTKRANLKALLLLGFQTISADRLIISGPGVELSPTTTRQLALVFHELMINAMKYGALSTPEGHVVIRWFEDGSLVRVRWQEKGGPAPIPSSRRGFGTLIIDRTLTALGGEAIRSYEGRGLVCHLSFRPR